MGQEFDKPAQPPPPHTVLSFDSTNTLTNETRKVSLRYLTGHSWGVELVGLDDDCRVWDDRAWAELQAAADGFGLVVVGSPAQEIHAVPARDAALDALEAHLRQVVAEERAAFTQLLAESQPDPTHVTVGAGAGARAEAEAGGKSHGEAATGEHFDADGKPLLWSFGMKRLYETIGQRLTARDFAKTTAHCFAAAHAIQDAADESIEKGMAAVERFVSIVIDTGAYEVRLAPVSLV